MPLAVWLLAAKPLKLVLFPFWDTGFTNSALFPFPVTSTHKFRLYVTLQEHNYPRFHNSHHAGAPLAVWLLAAKPLKLLLFAFWDTGFTNSALFPFPVKSTHKFRLYVTLQEQNYPKFHNSHHARVPQAVWLSVAKPFKLLLFEFHDTGFTNSASAPLAVSSTHNFMLDVS